MPQDNQINYNVKVRLDPNDTTITDNRSVIYDYSAKKFTLSTAVSSDIVVNEGTTRITTSDGTNTQVVANSYFRFKEDLGGTGGTGAGKLQIGSTSADPLHLVDIGQNNDTDNQILISSTNGDQSFLRLGMDSTDTLVAAFGSKTSTNQKFQVGTYPSATSPSFTPGFTINHDGEIGIGEDHLGNPLASPNSGLEISGNYTYVSGAKTSTVEITNLNNSPTNADNRALVIRLNTYSNTGPGVNNKPRFIDFQSKGASSGDYVSRGNIALAPYNGSVMFNTSSDKRLKKNFQSFPLGLNELLKINPLKYTWIDNNQKDLGFIAQELYEIYPYAVSIPQDKEDFINDPWSIDYAKLTPLLVKSIQDQQEIINKLEERIHNLEKK